MPRSVHEAFSAQVARNPDAVAVTSREFSLTYRELDERANHLADRLREIGIGPDVPVAVLVERSPNVVVAFLAALKAGGFYQPVHSAYPPDRKQWIIDHSGAKVLLSDKASIRDGLPSVDEVIAVDGLGDPEPRPVGSPDVGIESHTTAYVMYTSGSTGEPKGVAVRHEDALALALDSTWDTGRHERVLMLAPHAFNVSTYEIWVPLLHGGTVVVAPDEAPDIATLSRLIPEFGITALHLTAGLFRVVAEEAPESLHGVREVLTGGDVIAPGAVSGVLDSCRDIVVRSMYGATEGTVFSTTSPMSAPHTSSATVPVGRAMDGVELHVLDERLDPLPDGSVGELYLAGTGLALGYVGRPDLTAERFVANPFGEPGSRMYRTGDLVRRTPAGELEFVGRATDRMKVLGFRVEPAEIESVLASCPEIAHATVAARERPQDGEKRLVAYVVPNSAEPDLEAVRARTRASLPEYMMPSAFVVIDRLPLTANGKVDRSGLPEPAFDNERTYRAPSGPTEKTLCAVFADVLGVPEIGVDDSFFDLGGHSLLAMRLLNRIHSELGVELRITTLFDTPTVAALARTIRPEERRK